MFKFNLIFICLVLLGLLGIVLTRINGDADKVATQIQIDYRSPKLSARNIEREVTSKLEGVLSSLDNVSKIRSESHDSWGRIVLDIKAGSDIQILRFEISNLIGRVYKSLPQNLSYPKISINLAGEDIEPDLIYSVAALNTFESIDQNDCNLIKNLLFRIEGIREVRIDEVTDSVLNITLKSQLLDNFNLNVDEVQSTINSVFSKKSFGKVYFDNYNNSNFRYLTVLQNSEYSIENLGDIPIKNIDGRVIYLRDISSISTGRTEEFSYEKIDGLPSKSMIIYCESGYNMSDLSLQIKTALSHSEISHKISTVLVYNRSDYLRNKLIQHAFQSIAFVSLLGLILFVFHRNLKRIVDAMMWTLISIISSFSLFPIFEISINVYSVLGLSISTTIIFYLRYSNESLKPLTWGVPMYLSILTPLFALVVLNEPPEINLMLNILVPIYIQLLFHYLLLSIFRGLVYDTTKPSVVLLPKAFHKAGLKFIKVWLIIFFRAGVKLKYFFFIVTPFVLGIPIEGSQDLVNNYLSKIGFEINSDKNEIFNDLQVVIGGVIVKVGDLEDNEDFNLPSRTILNVIARFPEGSPPKGISQTTTQIEEYIREYEGIDFFRTSLMGSSTSKIEIYFKQHAENGMLPFFLKESLQAKTSTLSSCDWFIYGVGEGFSNSSPQAIKLDKILIYGYDYDKLTDVANEVITKLGESPRVKNVTIQSRDRIRTTNIREDFIRLDLGYMNAVGISQKEISKFINGLKGEDQLTVNFNNDLVRVNFRIDSVGAKSYWEFSNKSHEVERNSIKLSEISSRLVREIPNEIFRTDQQYQLVLSYDFDGPVQLSEKIKHEVIDKVAGTLPVGFKITADNTNNELFESKTLFKVLFSLLLLAYFSSSIFFESFSYSNAIVLSMISSFIVTLYMNHYLGYPISFATISSFVLLTIAMLTVSFPFILRFKEFGIESVSRMKISSCYLRYSFNFIITILICTTFIMSSFLSDMSSSFWFNSSINFIFGISSYVVFLVFYLPICSLRS